MLKKLTSMRDPGLMEGAQLMALQPSYKDGTIIKKLEYNEISMLVQHDSLVTDSS